MRTITITFKIFIVKILFFAVSFISSIIVARLLGPSGKGELAIVFLVSGLAISFGSLNIGESAIYFHNRKGIDIGTIIATNFSFIFLSSIIYVSLLSFFSISGFLPWKELQNHNLLLFTCILIPSVFVQYHMLDITRAIRQFDFYCRIVLMQPLAYLLLVLVFVYFMRLHVFGALLASVLAFQVSICGGIFSVFSGKKIKLKSSFEYFRKQLIYGMKGHLGNVFQKFNMRLDQLFITPFWSSEMLGYYSVAVIFSELVFFIPDSLGVVLLPKIANGEDNSEAIIQKTLRVALPIIFILICCLYVIAKPFVQLFYGSAYLPAVSAIYLLLPGIFLMCVSKIVSKYFSGVGRPEINTYTSIISGITTIVLCIYLVPRYAIQGAAIASSFAYGLRAVCDIIILSTLSGKRFTELLILNKDDLRQISKVCSLSFFREIWK